MVSDAADGKLAIEFSSVEGFGELGKRNLGAEVEVKEWLSMFKKEWKENIWTQKREVFLPRRFTKKEKRNG